MPRQMVSNELAVSMTWRKPDLWESRYAMWVDHFVSKGLVFVHIPKTGGTAVESVLFNEKKSQHYTAAELMRNSRLAGLASFSVVRNPYWRFVSAYNYLRNGGNKKIAVVKDNAAWASLIESMSFEAFVKLVCDPKRERDLARRMKEHGAADGVMFVPQHVFLCDGDGKVLVDQCFTQEQMSAEGKIRLARHGTLEIAHVNRTRRKAVTGLSNTTAMLIYNRYQRDFALFGYLRESWQQQAEEKDPHAGGATAASRDDGPNSTATPPPSPPQEAEGV